MPAKSTKGRSGALSLPLVLLLSGVVLVVAAVWIVVARPGQEAEEPFQVTGPYPEVARISPAGAKAGVESENGLIVDVRGESDYAAAHIAGALHLPATDIETRYRELPQERPIYLYCT